MKENQITPLKQYETGCSRQQRNQKSWIQLFTVSIQVPIDWGNQKNSFWSMGLLWI